MAAYPPSEQRARIAWVSNAGGPDPSVRRALREAHYALSDLKDERFADIAIVDLRSEDVSPRTARKLAGAARRSSPHGGVVYFANPSLDAPRRGYLRRSGTLVIAGDDPELLVAACRERLRARNLAEEAGERLKSYAEAGALRQPADFVRRRPPFRVLVAGAPSPLSLSVLSVAQRAGYRVEGVLSAAQALSAIETDRFDCGVFLPQAPSDPLRSLAATLRRRNRQADFPILTLDDGPATGENSFLARHVEDDLPDAIAAAVRTAQQTHLIKRFLTAGGHGGAWDGCAEAASAAFFARHAARLLARARETERPFALLSVHLDAAFLSQRNAADIAGPLRQASGLISSITRTEDMAARIAPTTFAVTLPATTGADADRIADRLTGVVQNTMFRLRDEATGDHDVFALSARAAALADDGERRLEEMVAQLIVQTKTDRGGRAEGARATSP